MSKGSFIHGLLSFLFTVLSNKKEFHAKLLQIADSHCRKGVKAIEYGIIGEVYIIYNDLSLCYCQHYRHLNHDYVLTVYMHITYV